MIIYKNLSRINEEFQKKTYTLSKKKTAKDSFLSLYSRSISQLLFMQLQKSNLQFINYINNSNIKKGNLPSHWI